MSITKLPHLFKLDGNGKEWLWKIKIDDDTIIITSGTVEGKKKTTTRTFEGKSIGKKNETTPSEQAIREGEKRWIKQTDKGYRPQCKEGQTLLKKIQKEKIANGGHNINASSAIRGREKKNVKKVSNFIVPEISSIVKPILAAKWELKDEKDLGSVLPKVSKHFDFEKGVFIDPKYDGIRCLIYIIKNSSDEFKIAMFSRQGKQFRWFKHIRDALIRHFTDNIDLFDKYSFEYDDYPSNSFIILDGELYADYIKEDDEYLTEDARFSLIQGICGIGRSNAHELEEQIHYKIFDCINPTKKYLQTARNTIIKNLFNDSIEECLDLVPRIMINDISELPDLLVEYSKNHEGLIIRAHDLVYSDKRALKLRKFKLFEEKEFEVVGAKCNTGVGTESFSWICINEDGNEFNAKHGGLERERQEMYENYKDYIGMQLTVRFQGRSEDNIPRFPAAKAFREEFN